MERSDVMENFSWLQILVLVFGGGGAIAGLIQLFSFILARLDKNREEKRRLFDTHISNAVDFEKEKFHQFLESASFTKETFVEVITMLRAELAEVKRDVSECEKRHDEKRIEIELLENENRRQAKEIEDLQKEVEKLKK